MFQLLCVHFFLTDEFFELCEISWCYFPIAFMLCMFKSIKKCPVKKSAVPYVHDFRDGLTVIAQSPK